MKKVLIFITIFSLIMSNFSSLAFAQEISPSATLNLTPTPSPAPSKDPVLEAIKQIYGIASISATTDADFPADNPNFSITNPENKFSANFISQPIIRTLSKRSFRSNENVEVNIDNADGKPLYVSITDKNGEDSDFDFFTVDNGSTKTVRVKPKRQFKPGKYTITVTDGAQSYAQDFTWGVLAINTNKSIYTPNEISKLSIAVLDEAGNVVCDAKVNLIINSPDGNTTQLSTDNKSIKVNPECQTKDVTSIPDYETEYSVSAVGIYGMTLSAQTKNGNYTIMDGFEVKESVPFDVERVTATRIFPINSYTVDLNITANQDFSGDITESVPGDFAIEQSPTSEIPFDTPETVSQTAVDPLLNASVSAKLGMPFLGNFPISEEFGEKLKDKYEKNLYQQFNLAGHDGVDFDMPVGTPVLAVDDGKVVMAGGQIYGVTVVIQHSWGKSYYGHLSKVQVNLGEKVSKGDQIALSGNTGLTTGPHLHFGVKPDSTNIDNGYYGKIDPLPFLGIQSQLDSSQLIKLISWKVNVKKGDKIKLSYVYKAPNTSPQFYLIGKLRFYESEQNVFSESRSWQIAVDAPSNQFVKQSSFTKRNGTGSQSVTGLGFKPKAIIFWWTNQTADGTTSPATGVAMSMGTGFATDSTHRAAVSVWDEAENNAGTADAGRIEYTNNVIVIQSTNGATTPGVADFTSMDADGFTLNWSTSDASAYVIHYQAFAETIISNATVNNFTLNSGIGSQSITTAGFQPDFVILMSAGSATQSANQGLATFTIGAANSSASRWTVGYKSDDDTNSANAGPDSTDTCSVQRTDNVLYMISNKFSSTASDCSSISGNRAIADFTQFTSNGFDINKSTGPTETFNVDYLALKGNGISFTTGNFTRPTAAGISAVTGTNFLPQSLFFASNMKVSGSSPTANGHMVLGGTSGVGQEGSSAMNHLPADTATPDVRTSRTKTISTVENETVAVSEANLVSFDTNGFTLNWTGVADATADQYLYWTIMQNLQPVNIMRHGDWFNNGVRQPFSF